MWHKRFKSPCPASIDFALTFGKLKSWGTVVRVIRRYKDAESVCILYLNSLETVMKVIVKQARHPSESQSNFYLGNLVDRDEKTCEARILRQSN